MMPGTLARTADQLRLLRLSARPIAGRRAWLAPLLPLAWPAFQITRLLTGLQPTAFSPADAQNLLVGFPLTLLGIGFGVRIIAGEIDQRTLEIAYTVPGGAHRVWIFKLLAAIGLLLVSEALLAVITFLFCTSFPLGALYGAFQGAVFYMVLAMASAAMFRSEVAGALITVAILALNVLTLTGQNDNGQGDNGQGDNGQGDNGQGNNGQGNNEQVDYFRGFEDSPKDNWPYTTNIPFYALNSGDSDLWSDYSQANGRVEGSFMGASYLAGRDLDNPYSEAYTGLESPEHILDFAPFDLGGSSAEFTFRLNYVSLDRRDYIYYEINYDNGTSWSSADEHVDVYLTTQPGPHDSFGWEEVRFDVPSGHEYVRVRLVIYQNGNGYLGLDNFELKMPTLSTSNNKIDGFTFGPNPTNGILTMSAKVVLDEVTIFDVLGKEVIKQKGDSREMKLNLKQLANGVYLARVESEGITQTVRIVKK